MLYATSHTSCLMEPSAFVFCFHLKNFLFWLIVEEYYSTTGIYCEQYGYKLSKDRQYTWRKQLNEFVNLKTPSQLSIICCSDVLKGDPVTMFKFTCKEVTQKKQFDL